MQAIEPGAIRLRGVSRNFRIAHERNVTLKETLLRRRRSSYTELWALRNVDLDVAPGESLGIIGQNGSGKSTLLKLIAGILPPQTGTVEAGGSVASMLELGAGFHPDFTGRENVYMNGSIHGLSEREVDRRFDEIVDFAELDEFIEMPVKTYSSGMQMRLAFAVASHVSPDILLLDEVLAVGDEAFQRKCFGRIFAYRQRGGTLVFVSHDPGIIELACDRVILIDGGHIEADGSPGEVLAQYHRLLAENESPDPRSHRAAPDDPLDDGSGRVWGSRQAVVTAVRLTGGDGATNRFVSGNPFAIELDVLVDAALDTPVFGIAIHSAGGALCYGTNTRLDGLEAPAFDGVVTVRFEVPELHLHEGQFVLTIGVHSADERTVYHWLDHWVEFTVFQRATGTGPVDLSGTWTITTGAHHSGPATPLEAGGRSPAETTLSPGG